VTVEDAVAVAVADEVGVADTVGVGVAVCVCVAVRVAVGDGPGAPTPASFTFWGLFDAASLNFSRPFLNLPILGGANVTETGQLADGAIALVHPSESRLKPAPVTVTIGAGKSTPPLLVNVTVCGLLRVPAGTLPKFIALGDSATAGLLLAATETEISLSEGCAFATPPGAYKSAQMAIATAIARREKITIRRYLNGWWMHIRSWCSGAPISHSPAARR
jgi:hypothetical protein